MRVFLPLALLAAWTALCLGAWAIVRDRPLIRSLDPAPALTGDASLYLNRSYRFDVRPPQLVDPADVVTPFGPLLQILGAKHLDHPPDKQPHRQAQHHAGHHLGNEHAGGKQRDRRHARYRG